MDFDDKRLTRGDLVQGLLNQAQGAAVRQDEHVQKMGNLSEQARKEKKNIDDVEARLEALAGASNY